MMSDLKNAGVLLFICWRPKIDNWRIKPRWSFHFSSTWNVGNPIIKLVYPGLFLECHTTVQF